MKSATPESKGLAQRLLAHEIASAGASRHAAGAMALAVFRVCEKLRLPLLTLAGAEGFRSLLSRALALARAEAPSMSAVQVNEDGSLAGLLEAGSLPGPGETDDGGTLLVAHLLGLLFTFIGESLTMRLVDDAWPDVSFEPTNRGSTEMKTIDRETEDRKSEDRGEDDKG